MTDPGAFLVYSGRLYHSGAGSVRTPLCQLIESVWDQFPEQAFHLLRNRIFTNYPIQHSCRGAVKVAAKRATTLQPAEYTAQFNLVPDRLQVGGRVAADRSFAPPAGLTAETCAEWMRSYPFSAQERPVLAVLLDPDSRPILAAANSASSNRFHHAEVNLISAFVRRNGPVPKGSRILVSLKPCCMCAGMIADHCEDGTDTVVAYLENDPGPKARGGVLKRMSHW